MSIQMQVAMSQLLQGFQNEEPKMYQLFNTMIKELSDIEAQLAILLALATKLNNATGKTILTSRQVMRRISLRA